jgi:hypothetical protein
MYCNHVWLIVLAQLWKYPLAPPGAPTPTTTQLTPSRDRGNYRREMAGNFANSGEFHTIWRDLLHATNLRHGTDGFTSPPKDGMQRIFFALKNLTASAGFEPANLGTRGQHATPRPPKLLYGIALPLLLQFWYWWNINCIHWCVAVWLRFSGGTADIGDISEQSDSILVTRLT